MRIKQLCVAGLLLAFACASVMLPQDTMVGPHVACAQENEADPPLEAPKEMDNGLRSAEASSPAATVAGDAADEKPVAKAANSSLNESTQLAQKIRASLKKVGDLQYADVQFSDVRRDLEKLLEVNIVLDVTAIDDCLTEEELINCRIKNVSYSNGLRLLLAPFNATYIVKDEVIRIISIDNINDPRNYSAAMINVRPTLDLIKKFDGRTNSPRLPNQKIQKSEIPMVILSDTIMSLVHPEAWQETGTGKAVLKIAGGVLIVRGTEEVLDEVKYFMQDFHAQLEANTD